MRCQTLVSSTRVHRRGSWGKQSGCLARWFARVRHLMRRYLVPSSGFFCCGLRLGSYVYRDMGVSILGHPLLAGCICDILMRCQDRLSQPGKLFLAWCVFTYFIRHTLVAIAIALHGVHSLLLGMVCRAIVWLRSAPSIVFCGTHWLVL